MVGAQLIEWEERKLRTMVEFAVWVKALYKTNSYYEYDNNTILIYLTINNMLYIRDLVY